MTQQDLQNNINNAIDAGGFGRTVTIPPGDIVLTETLNIPSSMSLPIIGSGGQTRLRWQGPLDKPMVRMSGTHHARIADLTLVADTPCSAMLLLTRTPGEPFITTACEFANIWFGNNQPRCASAIEIINPQGMDQNNELHRFLGCEFTGYTRSAVRIHGGQIHAIAFQDCGMNGNSLADYGIECEYGAYIHWVRGTGGFHKKWDFYLKNFLINATVENWNSEGSGGYLCNDQADWNPAPVTIRGGRWEGNPVGNVIATQNVGVLTVEGVELSASVPDTRLTINAATLGGQHAGQVRVIGNTIYSNNDYDAQNRFVKCDRSQFGVEYHSNTFRRYDTQTPSVGDQDPLSGSGLPLATPTQDGVWGQAFQTLPADKMLVNNLAKKFGLRITSLSSDGRMRIEDGNGVGLTMYGRWGLFECDKNMDLRLPGNVLIPSGAAYGTVWGVGAHTSNAKSEFTENSDYTGVAPNGSIDSYTARYAGTHHPGRTWSAPWFEFYIAEPSSMTPGSRQGQRVLRMDATGIHIDCPLWVNNQRVG